MPTVSNTRKSLRRAIADKLQDLIVVTATSASAADVIIDDENLTDSDNSYRSCFVLATGGTAGNLGLTRRVLTSVQVSTQVNLLTAFPDTVADGDEFELLNLRGIGFRPQDYHRAINEAIGLLRFGEHQVRLMANVSAAFDADSPTVTIPSTVEWIDRVQYSNDDTPEEWVDIPLSRTRDSGGLGWTPLGLTGTISINGTFRLDADGHDLRVFGYGPLSDLDDDADTVDAPSEFIVYWASHVLALRRGGPEWTPKAMLFRQIADQSRPRSTTPWASGVVRIR